MNTMRKIMALFLTLAMVMSLSITAFAVPATTTITAPNTDRTYAVYQIMTGDLAGGVLSNVKWGTNAKDKTGSVPEALTQLEAANTAATDKEKLDVITRYVALDSEAVGTITNGGQLSVPTGYYLIQDLGVASEDADGNPTYVIPENQAVSLYVVQVVGPTVVQPKETVPSVIKTILDPTPVAENEASIGDRISYEVTATLPDRLDDYDTYYLELVDTMSKGLTYCGDMKVYLVNGEVRQNITQCFSGGLVKVDANGVSTIQYAMKDLLALNQLEGFTVNASSQIVFDYSAILNVNAVIAGDGNPNTAKLVFSNDPNHSGTPTPVTPPPENPPEPPEPPTPDEPPETPPTPPEVPQPGTPTGETPESTVVTYTTQILLQKVDGNGEFTDALAGATFTLEGDGVNVTLVSAEKFVASPRGTYYQLLDGKYTTTAPVTEQEGYTADKYVAPVDGVYTMYEKTVELTPMGNLATVTPVTGVVDENGQITFAGLGAGTYTLKETVTPAGYNTCAPVVFTITFDGDTHTFSVGEKSGVSVNGDFANTFYVEIVNQHGFTLPGTGGVGTTLFYGLGAVLVLGAGVLLVTKKRVG